MRSLFTKKQSDVPRRRLDSNSVRKQAAPTANMFIRNRTLTGATSNYLNNPSIGNSNLESSRSHVHRLTNHRRRVLSLLLSVVVIISALWLFLSNFTAVPVISVSATGITKTIDFTRYEKVIQEYLDINPTGRLRFMLDQKALYAYVFNKLPEVSAITQQDMASFGKTNFAVSLRTPVAGWSMNNNQYYVDSRGVSFQVNYYATPTVQIIDNSGATPTSGATFVSNRFLSFVGQVVSASNAAGYTVTQAFLPVNTTRELDIYVEGNSTIVKLSIDRPAGEQIQDMDNAFKYFASKVQSPGYIDIRVSGKAFYK